MIGFETKSYVPKARQESLSIVRFNVTYIRMSLFILFIVLAGLSSSSRAADVVVAKSAGGMWGTLDQISATRQQREPWIRPPIAQQVLLDEVMMKASLDAIPRDDGQTTRLQPSILLLPAPNGTFERFEIVSSSVMPPELANKYPDIRAFRGKGVDNPAATVRLEMSPQGFHGQVLSPNGTYYIDPYSKGDTQLYSSYYKRDYTKTGIDWNCAADDPQVGAALKLQSQASGDILSTYRLACSATGEYTAFHGGTVAKGLAAIVTAINRVSGIYELEVGVRLELIPNNDLLVYTNPTTDPFTNLSGGAMLSENQTTIDTIIGSANYDIGHVFSTGGGGIAGLSVVCNPTSKAQGVTGLTSPTGDPFYVDYVAHEMGHQFGGSHTFNGVGQSCGGNRTGSSAYEPGSGSTIQAYSGICGLDNLQFNSDPYFHSRSYDQIRAFVLGSGGSSCAALTATFNTPPTVNSISDFVIPWKTPFELVAAGQDADNDTLTYCWEERDLGPAQAVSDPDNGISPIFRSFAPTVNPARSFPALTSILNGTTIIGEQLPSTYRVMDFRVTVRDNHTDGGGIAFEELSILVDSSAGPFAILEPNGGELVGGARTVRWDIAGTDANMVNTLAVDILLSTDGGMTYPEVLALNTPNDGSEIVNFSAVISNTARLRIQGSGNVFFDVSDNNFSIDPAATFSVPLPATHPYNIPNNRYISFDPNNAALAALRVDLVSGPGLTGTLGWVAAPFDPGCQNENGTPKAGVCTGQFVARISATPVLRNWTEPMVHLSGCHIVPVATYEISATSNEVLFSVPITLSTSGLPAGRFWGDSVGNFFGEWTGPDGLVTANDIVAVVDTFQDNARATVVTRTDLDGQIPNFIINGSDILQAITAFQGQVYPYANPSDCP